MRQRVWLYIATIIIGLWCSATAAGGLLSENLAEWPVNIWCWGVLGWVFANTNRKERIEIIAVVIIATPMELFFSEVWLIYEYQRGIMPLFVPAGHYFLFDLGRHLARVLKASLAMPLLFPFVPLVLYGALTGGDTSGVVLLILVFGFTKWGPQPRLYAAMAWAALGMEIEILDEHGGRVRKGEQGELVCASVFPSMPVRFLNDPDDEKLSLIHI